MEKTFPLLIVRSPATMPPVIKGPIRGCAVTSFETARLGQRTEDSQLVEEDSVSENMSTELDMSASGPGPVLHDKQPHAAIAGQVSDDVSPQTPRPISVFLHGNNEVGSEVLRPWPPHRHHSRAADLAHCPASENSTAWSSSTW